MKPAIRLDRLILGAALFLSAFANIAFFRNLLATFAGQAGGYLHVASLAVLLFLVAAILDLETWTTISLYLLWLALALAALSGGKQIYDLIKRPPGTNSNAGRNAGPDLD